MFCKRTWLNINFREKNPTGFDPLVSGKILIQKEQTFFSFFSYESSYFTQKPKSRRENPKDNNFVNDNYN